MIPCSGWIVEVDVDDDRKWRDGHFLDGPSQRKATIILCVMRGDWFESNATKG
jgi:hypothetical protein